MRSRKRVWIDFTYYEPGNLAPIAAFFKKSDPDQIAYIREPYNKKAARYKRKQLKKATKRATL